ncbi:MAG: hypothetical protein IJI14_11835 [Anaerolineaceae bacterium]|nr:hypothetical protein [Anaerolineaceae bacterium]
MKKHILVLAVIFVLAVFFSTVLAEDEANATYGETYMCGDAFTARIVTQPQMMSQIIEKIAYYTFRQNMQTGRYSQYQINVLYGNQTEEDILLLIRLQIRNLNSKSVHGLSPESFKLTGKVRDRVIEYEPEIMMPFIVEDDDWELPMIRAGLPVANLTRGLAEFVTYDINDYWNPLLMNEKDIDSMRLQDIRLIYRVPSWLVGWDLHISPKPMTADSELKTCNLTLHLPTIMNEITRETYKYIY